VEQDPNAHQAYLDAIDHKDVWVITEGKSRKAFHYYTDTSFRHPAKMPPALAVAILEQYTKPGDTVLDPMAGIGTTVVEASRLGRNGVGVEYEEKFCRMANENIGLLKAKGLARGGATVVRGDSRDLPGALKEWDAVKTSAMFSPPYGHEGTIRKDGFNLKRGEIAPFIQRQMNEGRASPGSFGGERYSSDPANIGNLRFSGVAMSPPFMEQKTPGLDHNPFRATGPRRGEKHGLDGADNVGSMSGQSYEQAMILIYRGVHDVLPAGAPVVVHTKNFVRGGCQVRLDLITIALCEQAGMRLVERKYRLLTSHSFWIRNAMCKWTQKHPGEQHPYPRYEDILVLRTGA